MSAGVLERRSLVAVRTAPRGVLVPGDWVRWRGGRHYVAALDGMTVYLADRPDAEVATAAVLLSVLAGAPDFAVLDRSGQPVQQKELPNFALLEGISEKAAERARMWERAVIEVDTGLPPDAAPGARPRAAYDPASTTLVERYQAKAEELRSVLGLSVSWQTVQAKRLRYLGHRTALALVDGRSIKSTQLYGKCDPLVVEALLVLVDRQQRRLDPPSDARKLFKQVKRMVRSAHGHKVQVPAEPTMYKLLKRLGLEARDLAKVPSGSRGTAGDPPQSVTRATMPGELVQIDSTDLDVWVLGDDGRPARAEATCVVDVATRSIIAAAVRPKQPGRRVKQRVNGKEAWLELPPSKGRATKAVDVSLLLAQCMVPVPMRPGWDPAVHAQASELPFEELVALDARFAHAAARPVIIPDLLVIDHGTVFAGQTFFDACAYLGISVRPARKRTGRDKAIVERTFETIKSGFSQYVNTYTGNVPVRSRRKLEVDGQELWTVAELDDLLQQWIALKWQTEPHPELNDPRDTYLPDRSPNQMYRALVEVEGYLPIPMNEQDFIPLLPTAWVGVSAQGIHFRNRTYDNPERDPDKGLNPFRGVRSGRRRSGRGGWELRYNPNDPSRVWLRDPDKAQPWVEATWVHQHRVDALWSEFLWDIAKAQFLESGGSIKDAEAEVAIAIALADLLERLGRGPQRDGTVVVPPDGYVAMPPPAPRKEFNPYEGRDPALWEEDPAAEPELGGDPFTLSGTGLSPALGAGQAPGLLDWEHGAIAPDPALLAWERGLLPGTGARAAGGPNLHARYEQIFAELDQERDDEADGQAT